MAVAILRKKGDMVPFGDPQATEEMGEPVGSFVKQLIGQTNIAIDQRQLLGISSDVI
jgi:hypothetical protein